MTHEEGAASSSGNHSPVTLPAAATASTGSAAVGGAATATMTITETTAQPPATEQPPLRLTLRARPTVRWDENVIDNEGLGRKSSKRCCIFHKQRAFDESSTDSSDQEDSDGSDDDEDGKESATKKNRKIARPKKGNDVPDFQRFHA